MAATDVWGLFEVNKWKTLSYANFEVPRTRREAYYLPPADLIKANDIEACQPLEWHVERYFDELVEESEEDLLACGCDPADGWRLWYSSADEESREALARSIAAWLEEEPNWGDEWECLYETGDPQGAAYKYFLTVDRKTLAALSIDIIEGDHPGSTYFAAELRIPAEEANAIAERLGLDIRFVREGA